MGVDIGAQRESFFKDVGRGIMFDDPRIDVSYLTLDHHRCTGCFGEIDGDAYEVVVRHDNGASVLFLHLRCYDSLFE